MMRCNMPDDKPTKDYCEPGGDPRRYATGLTEEASQPSAPMFRNEAGPAELQRRSLELRLKGTLSPRTLGS
jgi:hypothetical protein